MPLTTWFGLLDVLSQACLNIEQRLDTCHMACAHQVAHITLWTHVCNACAVSQCIQSQPRFHQMQGVHARASLLHKVIHQQLTSTSSMLVHTHIRLYMCQSCMQILCRA